MSKKSFAVPRGANPSPVALNKGDSKLLLQFANGFGDGRLADVENTGGLNYTLMTSNLHEGLKMAKLYSRSVHLNDTQLDMEYTVTVVANWIAVADERNAVYPSTNTSNRLDVPLFDVGILQNFRRAPA